MPILILAILLVRILVLIQLLTLEFIQLHGIKNKILQKSERKHLINFMRSSVISMMRKGIVAFADFREGGLQGIEQITEATSGLSIKCIRLGRPEYYYDVSQDFNQNPKFPPDVIELIYNILNIADGLGISGANENTDNSLKEYRRIIQKESLKKKILVRNSCFRITPNRKKSITATGKSEATKNS